jgi:Immunity protein 35
MISIEAAEALALSRLKSLESEINSFGSNLPIGEQNLEIQLDFSEVIEFDLGWVFCYNTRKFLSDRSQFSSSLVGNAPFIVSREDGSIHVTGTAHDIDHYVESFRAQFHRD